MQVKGHPMLRKPQPMIAMPNPHIVRKYYEFQEQNGHATAECSELKKALDELIDKGQIDRFLKRRPQFLRKEHNHECTEPREEECFIEIVTTIVGGYTEDITQSRRKAYKCGAQKVLTAEWGSRVTVPTMVFDIVKAPILPLRILTLQWLS